MYKVNNAVIMAAGTSSRFAPLSYERPKALTVVKGEVLIERQIRQIKKAGIDDIFIVTGYKAEQFEYLKEKLGVKLIYNPNFLVRNNNASIFCARHVIKNSYICSADDYFSENPFEKEVESAYYSAVYSFGHTDEWCMTEKNGIIDSVEVGGQASWYMLGHVFWDENFSEKFIKILEGEYDKEETKNLLWEDIYIDHINELPMRMRKYPIGEIYEFDTLDELRKFDPTYVNDTRSAILKSIAEKLNVREADIGVIKSFKDKDESAAGFTFMVFDTNYRYSYQDMHLEEV